MDIKQHIKDEYKSCPNTQDDTNSPIYATRWYFQEPIYTYYYYKDTETSSGDPSGNDGVTNVVKYVKYIK